MINRLTVLNNGGLSDILPIGHTIKVDSGLVLIVGENGVGKTATLRLINTSLEHRIFFNAHGVSQSYYDRGFNALSYQQVSRLDRGYDFLKQISNGLKEDEVLPYEETLTKIREFQTLYPGLLQFDEAKDLRAVRVELGNLTPEGRRLAEGKLPFSNVLKTNSDLITLLEGQRYNVDCKVMLLEDMIRIKEQMRRIASNPELLVNIWGYVSLDLQLEDGMDIYLLNVPSYGEFGIKLGHGGRWGGEKDSPANEFMHYSPHGQTPTPGLTTKEKLEEYIARIHEFFRSQKRKHLIRKPPKEGITNFYERKINAELEAVKGPYEAVEKLASDKDRLVVLMDEPTVFLSYRNKYWFRDQITELLKQYKNRLQIFIATNDPILIERTPEAGFIDMYSRPARFTEEFSLGEIAKNE